MITSQALEKVEPSDISRLLSWRQRSLDVRANPSRSRDRRYPAHLTATEIGLVDTDDCDGLYIPALVGIGDGRAEKDLVQLLLLLRVHHLGALQIRSGCADRSREGGVCLR